MEKKMQLQSAPQLAKIAALLVLFLLSPFVPSSLRQTYLYMLFNALDIALGIEAGFLAAISVPRDDKKPPSRTASTNLHVKPRGNHAAVSNARLLSSAAGPLANTPTTTRTESPNKLLADAVLAKDAIVGIDAASMIKKKKIMKKCPSRASIFFIGSMGGEGVDVTVHDDEEEEERRKGAGDELIMSNQELFTKAEAFIGNFYKQLKMQREESWKKLQDLYYHHHYKTNKAF